MQQHARAGGDRSAAQQPVALVTGTSGGIGAAVAAELRSRGWTAFGTSRRADGQDPHVLPLDVTDDSSAQACVDTVLQRAGRLDAVVNNAGVDVSGAVEETTVDEARALFETNLFGVHRVVRAALPVLREQRHGRILVVGSLAGFVPVPFEAFYVASKHALEGYVGVLAHEVAPFGVQCGLVEPGFVRTPLSDHKARAALRLPAYAGARRRAEAAFDRGLRRGVPPERVGAAVADALDARRTPLHTRVGTTAKLLPLVHRSVPAPVFRTALRVVFG